MNKNINIQRYEVFSAEELFGFETDKLKAFQLAGRECLKTGKSVRVRDAEATVGRWELIEFLPGKVCKVLTYKR